MMEAFFPYFAETGTLTVRVSVNYLPEQSQPHKNHWFWAYHIRIENHGLLATQLLGRTWIIEDARCEQQLVEGEGVVGDQPVIKPGASYDYVSGCTLTTPSGTMEGSYQMIGEDGSRFDIAIPCFELKAPVTTG